MRSRPHDFSFRYGLSVLSALLVGGASIVSCRSAAAPESAPEDAILAYPETQRGAVVERLHGIEVADPYRWLEDLDAPETKAWVEAQNRLTFGFLERIPEREAILARLRELWDYERYGLPTQRGGRYFFTKNDGLQNQPVLYSADALDGEPRVLLDPNALSEDGTVAIAGWRVSDDGRLLAYGLSAAGSDWQEWRVREVDTGMDRPDVLRWVKFSSASWTPDGAGFFYSRYDEPSAEARYEELNYNQKLFYHRVGTTQEEDRLIYSRPDHKEWFFDGRVTEDGRYLIITVSEGTDPRTRVTYKGLGTEDAPVVELLADFDAEYQLVGNDGPVFTFRTNLDAPRGRLVAIDTSNPKRESWRELVPQAEETLVDASLVQGHLVAVYLRDAHSLVRLFLPDGSFVRELELPGLGTAHGFGGRMSDRETFYAFTSFTLPTTIYRADLSGGETSVFRKPGLNLDPDAYATRQEFATSKDGTRVPIFLSYRRGIERNGANPTLLYGYGGFQIAVKPHFSVQALRWMELGGIYAVAVLRGGGEYGEEWHKSGMKERKQNVFDDFIAAGEWLIAEGYTSREKLAIFGGSNGGLLVGACMTQRPELFGAALLAVGVLDMLRFHKFTIGWAWTSEYGSPEDLRDFKVLLAYSPLHNLRKGTRYPATLITTADHDDRVVPSHSFKFAAALQEAHAGPDPVLIRIETRAGHGGGKPTTKAIEEAADRLAFLVKALGASRVRRPR